MDEILDKKIQVFIKPDKPQAFKKLQSLMEMEINNNGIAKSLGYYLRIHEDKYVKLIHQDEEDFTRYMEIYKNLNLSKQEKQWVKELNDLFIENLKLTKEIIILDQKKEKSLESSVDVCRGLDAVLNDEIQVLTQKYLEDAEATGHKAVSTAGKVTIILVLAGFIVGSVTSAAIAHSITNPIKKLKDATIEIGKGKLETVIDVEANDEIGQLASSFKEMTKNLMQTTTSIDNLNREAAERKKTDFKLQEKLVELAETQKAALNMADDIEQANQTLGREINVRKKAEQRQNQLLKQLEKTNQELKDFAYVVSHDLKAPLRGINTLTNWISSDYADKLDEEGRQHLTLLSCRVNRMHNLIDGILQYSRVGRVKEEKSQVDLNELAREAIDMIVPPENISITIENELPVIECEKTRITQVFQNLLSNAIKYMDKPQGKISIKCAEENNFWKFSISDNGPGIEEQYYDKIFQMFQTLRPRDEFESTGVGLTVVKKIVGMYGGEIWLESKVGEGTTFFFTFSKQETAITNFKPETNAVKTE
jgi:signal transduction histidine kinase